MGSFVEWLNNNTFWGLDRTYEELKLAEGLPQYFLQKRLDRTYEELKPVQKPKSGWNTFV